jgi:bifunctional DNase/RNase
MIKKRFVVIPIMVIIAIFFLIAFTEDKRVQRSIFDIYCNTKTAKEIKSVNNGGERNVDICYLYLFYSGKKINPMLESIFLDDTETNIYFTTVKLKKGDIAWFLYSDINFTDEEINVRISNQFEFSAPIYLFYETIINPSLRYEILKIRKL